MSKFERGLLFSAVSTVVVNTSNSALGVLGSLPLAIYGSYLLLTAIIGMFYETNT